MKKAWEHISQNVVNITMKTIAKTMNDKNFNLLHNSQWITFPTQSCLVLYSFCASLLYSLTWLLHLCHHIIYNFYSSSDYNYYFLWVFHTSISWRSFTEGLSDSKSTQVSRTLLSILANAVLWMVSIHPLISNSSSPLYQALRDHSKLFNNHIYQLLLSGRIWLKINF